MLRGVIHTCGKVDCCKVEWNWLEVQIQGTTLSRNWSVAQDNEWLRMSLQFRHGILQKRKTINTYDHKLSHSPLLMPPFPPDSSTPLAWKSRRMLNYADLSTPVLSSSVLESLRSPCIFYGDANCDIDNCCWQGFWSSHQGNEAVWSH